MAPVRGRTMLGKLEKLRAKAKKKVRTKQDRPGPASELSDDAHPSPVAVQQSPNLHPTTTAEPDGLWESQHLAAGALCTPVSVGAATTAGVELTVDQSGTGLPLRSRKANQDCFGITPRFAAAPDALLAGVYDGHGAQGGDVARLTRDLVPAVMTDALEAHMARCGGALRDALTAEERRRAYVRLFHKAFTEAERALRDDDRAIAHAYSGTTATCFWLDGSDLFVAWAGDSRCIMGRRDGDDGAVHAVDLTWDQKPARADEKKRVRNAGGRVTRWKKGVGPQRVWLPDEWLPGLAMTRSVGDTILSRYGVVPSPEVTVTRLSAEESFVVAASDGVWEFMTSEEVVELVAKERERGSCAETAARELVNEAVRRWTVNESVVDDTTAVVMYMDLRAAPPPRKSSLMLGRVVDEMREFENRSIKDLFRARRVEIAHEARMGQPWLVADNGKLESFLPINHVVEDEDMIGPE